MKVLRQALPQATWIQRHSLPYVLCIVSILQYFLM